MSEHVPDTNENPVQAERKGRGVKGWLLIVAALVVILPIAAMFLWSVIALNYSYSDGDRAGYVQKFSKKGWVCKTWEGNLSMINIPGAAPEQWDFTVRDDSIAQIISGYMGKQVSLHYTEHPGVPTSCFGETQYYVTGVRLVSAP